MMETALLIGEGNFQDLKKRKFEKISNPRKALKFGIETAKFLAIACIPFLLLLIIKWTKITQDPQLIGYAGILTLSWAAIALLYRLDPLTERKELSLKNFMSRIPTP